MWTHLSRTGGGIGTRGPGESQLETDRRIIRDRIKKMKERVDQIRQQRATAARGRDRRLMPTVGIVGYTNSGKSTLLNALVGSEVARAEDKLFATLDPTSRQVKLGDGQTAIVTDTVGSSTSCPISWSTPSGRRSRRSTGPTCCSRWSTRPTARHRTSADRPGRPRRARSRRQAAARRAQQGRPHRRRPARSRPALADRRGDGADQCGDGVRPYTLRTELAAVLASLWVDIDLDLPYAAGDLLARVRERGSVDIDYGGDGVHVTGRVAPALAGELESVAGRAARNGS